MSLKHEPLSEPLQIYVKYLFLDWVDVTNKGQSRATGGGGTAVGADARPHWIRTVTQCILEHNGFWLGTEAIPYR